MAFDKESAHIIQTSGQSKRQLIKMQQESLAKVGKQSVVTYQRL